MGKLKRKVAAQRADGVARPPTRVRVNKSYEEEPAVHDPGPALTPGMKQMMKPLVKPKPAIQAAHAKLAPAAANQVNRRLLGPGPLAPPEQAEPSAPRVPWTPKPASGACDAQKVMALREALRDLADALNPDGETRCLEEASAFDNKIIGLFEGPNCSSSSARDTSRAAERRSRSAPTTLFSALST